jgi:hypothetical protein
MRSSLSFISISIIFLSGCGVGYGTACNWNASSLAHCSNGFRQCGEPRLPIHRTGKTDWPAIWRVEPCASPSCTVWQTMAYVPPASRSPTSASTALLGPPNEPTPALLALEFQLARVRVLFGQPAHPTEVTFRATDGIVQALQMAFDPEIVHRNSSSLCSSFTCAAAIPLLNVKNNLASFS